MWGVSFYAEKKCSTLRLPTFHEDVLVFRVRRAALAVASTFDDSPPMVVI
jgi:hypothetical protein